MNILRRIHKMKKETARQINEDGSDYENSTYYHCFVCELLCEVVSLLEENHIALTENGLLFWDDAAMDVLSWNEE